MPDLEIHYDNEDTGGSGEWAALYVHGVLVEVGDSYHAEERAFEITGVKIVNDSAFMQGQDQREGVAKTLDEVKAYAESRDARKAQAQALRDEAASLEAEARRIEAG